MSYGQHIVQNYAKAAFDFATTNNTIADWRIMLQNMNLLMTNNDLINTCKDPRLSINNLYDFFEKFIEQKIINNPFFNFIKILLENNRIFLLPAINQRFKELYNNTNNILAINFTCKSEFSQNHKNIIEQKILSIVSAKSLDASYTIDESILGGLIITIGDNVLDGSVRGQIAKLKKDLLRG